MSGSQKSSIRVYKKPKKGSRMTTTPFGKWFQIRWKEPLGRPECPYLYRWTLILFGFSIRLHHWIRSDDKRHFHDHASNFISIVLRGHYINYVNVDGSIHGTTVEAGEMWYSNATKRHYLDIPAGGAWTLLFFGRPYHKWGFYVNNHKWRPLRYFHKFGIPPCDVQ